MDTKPEQPPTQLLALERRVFYGFALAAVVLVLLGVVSYSSVVRFRADVGMVGHTRQVLNALSTLLADLAEAESSQRGYRISGLDSYRQNYADAARQAQAELSHLRELTRDNPAQQRNLDALEPLVTERLRLLQDRLQSRPERGVDFGQAAAASSHGKNIQDSLRVLVSNMENEENRLLGERDARASLSSLVTRITVVAAGGLALGLLVAAVFFVRRGFARSRSAEADLRSARDTLEEHVRERTSELVRSGAALRAGEERLARIIDSAMDAIVTVDEAQRITLFNPAAERMFGCPASDAIGTPLERFLPARFRTAHVDHMRAFGQNAVTRRTMGGFSPLRGLRTNGEEFPIEASISQVDVAGRKLFTAIVRDITETSKARETSNQLAAIVESTEDAIISKTLNGIITSWNPAAQKLFGFTSAEVLGKPMLMLFPPDRIPEEQQILVRIAHGETIQHFESQRIHKDGHRIDVAVTISPLLDNSGRVVGASTIARDITQRKHAEEELRQQAALLSLAPALVRDMRDRIVLWTRGMEQMYGFSKEEAFGRISHELLKTEFPQPLSEIQRILLHSGQWEGELTHQTRAGQRIVTASKWVLYRDAEGKPATVLEVNADISALKRAEALQLRSQKLEALGTLAGGIAHDFNNVLSAITGSASLAISQFPPDHPVQACLVEIEKAGVRAAGLVRQILTFSRPQDLNMEVQPLEPVVSEALKLVRSTLPAMVEIRADFAPELPKARVDATQLYQVIVNLATNAAHAIGDKPGLIEVKLDAPTVGQEEILLYSEVPAGHYVRLSVNDNGCGMDAATVQRIFDPFFTTKPTGKGTGLGLSVVHGIVNSHRAVLKVYSDVGKGTTFQIYFPAIAATVAPQRAAPVDAPSGHGERILFVDDEGVLVFIGTMTLEQNGYKATGMPNGDAALRELQQNPNVYDAIVTDLSMPALSGLQLIQRIRDLGMDLPVILTSGYVNPEDEFKASQLGVRAIVSKPMNKAEFLRALAAIFQAHTRARTNTSN